MQARPSRASLMVNITDTISIVEALWIAINLPMLVFGYFMRRHAKHKSHVFRSAPNAHNYPARLMLARQNVRNSGGRMVFNGVFLLLGVVAMFRPNTPLTTTGAIFTVSLYVVALYFAYLDIREYRERLALDRMIADGLYHRDPLQGSEKV